MTKDQKVDETQLSVLLCRRLQFAKPKEICRFRSFSWFIYLFKYLFVHFRIVSRDKTINSLELAANMNHSVHRADEE